jgi:uncharacterized protein (DUF427 family)
MAHSPAYHQHPHHTLTFDEDRSAVRVYVGDTLIAETRAGLNLREGGYPPVIYVPREDVRMDLLAAVDHTTHCPFKGDACYFDFTGVEGGADQVTQVAWSYEDPFDQMLALQGALAFYPDRARIEAIDPDARSEAEASN